jgi:energy-converting hydrogenase Eha subunit B
MSPTGSDSNAGTSGSPWATPNHSGIVCGDVIIAQPGDYSAWTTGITFSPGGCPSTTGGLTASPGGIYFATLLCAGKLGSCTLTSTSGTYIVGVYSSNWAVEGFQITSTGIRNAGQRGFVAVAYSYQTAYVAFINDIAYHVQMGFGDDTNGTDHTLPGPGVDEYAVIGSIAQNAANDVICLGAIDDVAPSPSQPYAGTHILFYGNFSYNTQATNGCPTDEETFLFDTMDAHGFQGQTVALNNMAWSSFRYGIVLFNQDNNPLTSALKQYILNNTTYNNSTLNSSNEGDQEINQNQTGAVTNIFENNISYQTHSNPCAFIAGALHGASSMVNFIMGNTGSENVAFSVTSGNEVCINNGGSGTFPAVNFKEDPLFANVTDLLNNQSGVPNCSAFTNTTACMGWNAVTSTLTTPSAISDLRPSSTHSAGKGYQLPSTTCANVNAPDGTALYPTWLKGVVYLHWNGTSITENADLVTKPCGL